MMIFLVLFIVWLFGYSVISLIIKEINLVLKVSLSMLIGLGFQAIFMLVFDLTGIPITLYSLLGASSFITAIISIKKYPVYITDFHRLKSKNLGLAQINFAWLFFLGITIYVLYGISMKGIYWPVAEYDSVTGYDFMAKMISSEKVLKVSIFQFSTNSIEVPRFIYPPLIAGSYALQHMCGTTSPRIIPAIFFICLLVGFYGSARYFTSNLAAMIATAFLSVTPELCSHAALSLTNLPNAAYASLSLILFYLYILKKETSWLYLSALMMALTLYSRSDSIVFSGAAMIVLFYDAFKSKNFKPFIIYSCIANSLFVSWTLYTKYVLHSNSSDFFEKTLFWNPEKLDKIFTYIGDFLVWDTQLYGIVFWLFFLLLIINFRYLKHDLTQFIIVSLVAWVFYTFLYYQMNYIQASLDAFMKASYKRGMFCFVPLVWFYIICNKRSVWAFNKIDQFLYK
ncbi:MAG: glycosyltransferase family 39 protein [Opitutaceae bacterium]|nr:glycosyltransferase family 39 protein [Cytophagales bacterium]